MNHHDVANSRQEHSSLQSDSFYKCLRSGYPHSGYFDLHTPLIHIHVCLLDRRRNSPRINPIENLWNPHFISKEWLDLHRLTLSTHRHSEEAKVSIGSLFKPIAPPTNVISEELLRGILSARVDGKYINRNWFTNLDAKTSC